MGRTYSYPSRSAFIVDQNSIVRDTGRQIDWAHVSESHRSTPGTDPVVVGVGSAGAAIDAVAVPVDALSGAIPSGTTLDFGGKKFARLTAAAAKGATSLTVAALATALVDADTATYPGVAGSGDRVLPAGTVIGTLLGSGKASPRVASTNPATGILETEARENDPVAAKSGYGVIKGGMLYENLLPDASGDPAVLPDAVKTELNAAGTGFAFDQYSDAR